MDKGQPQTSDSPEQREVEKLRMLIEQAIADGRLSQAELEAMKNQAWADGKITPEELELYSTLVLDKLRTGELKCE